MKRIFLLIPFLISLNSTAYADFGAAEAPNSSFDMKKNYDAWCGKRGNKCEVDFEKDSIIIDKTSSVKYSQITNFVHREEVRTCAPGQIFNCEKGSDTFYIDYLKNSGEKGQGVILFGNKKVATQFLTQMKQVTTQSIYTDPRCTRTGEVSFKGICMSNEQYIREKFKAKKEGEEKWEKFGDAIGEQIDKDRDYYLRELEITAPRKYEIYNYD